MDYKEFSHKGGDIPIKKFTVDTPDAMLLDTATRLMKKQPTTTLAYITADTLLHILIPRLYAIPDRGIDAIMTLLGLAQKEHVWWTDTAEWKCTRNVMQDPVLSPSLPAPPMCWLNIVKRIECFVSPEITQIPHEVAPIGVLSSIITGIWPDAINPIRRLTTFALICNTYHRFLADYANMYGRELAVCITGRTDCKVPIPVNLMEGFKRGYALCGNCNLWAILLATSVCDGVPFCPHMFKANLLRVVLPASPSSSILPLSTQQQHQQRQPQVISQRPSTLDIAGAIPLDFCHLMTEAIPTSLVTSIQLFHPFYPAPSDPKYLQSVIKYQAVFKSIAMRIPNASEIASAASPIGDLIVRYREDAQYAENIPSGTILASLMVALFSGNADHWHEFRRLLYLGTTLEKARACGHSISRLTNTEREYLYDRILCPIGAWILTHDDKGVRCIAARLLQFRDKLFHLAVINEQALSDCRQWLPLWFSVFEGGTQNIPMPHTDRGLEIYNVARSAIGEPPIILSTQQQHHHHHPQHIPALILPTDLRGCLLATLSGITPY